MKLRPVNRVKGGNRFCGPAAISALTGMTTDEAARLLRFATGRKKITGTSTWAVLQALACCGIRARMILNDPRAKAKTLAAWLRETHGKRSQVHLVVAGNHWQLIQGNRYVCGITREIVGLDHPKVKRRAKVTEVMTLNIAPGYTRPAIPAAARAVKKVDQNRRYRVEARRIAEEIGVVIDEETGFERKAWYVYHPDFEDEHDPCQGDHYAFDWQDVLHRVREYQRHLT